MIFNGRRGQRKNSTRIRSRSKDQYFRSDPPDCGTEATSDDLGQLSYDFDTSQQSHFITSDDMDTAKQIEWSDVNEGDVDSSSSSSCLSPPTALCTTCLGCVLAVLLYRISIVCIVLLPIVYQCRERISNWIKFWGDDAHYFWGSPCACRLYAVCTTALVLQRVWILLYGILIVLVWRVIAQLIVWGSAFVQSKEYLDLLKSISWLYHLALSNLEKAVKGGTFRKWIVVSAHHFWNACGRSFCSHLIRMQMHALNRNSVQEMKDVLTHAERLRGYLKQPHDDKK